MFLCACISVLISNYGSLSSFLTFPFLLLLLSVCLFVSVYPSLFLFLPPFITISPLSFLPSPFCLSLCIPPSLSLPLLSLPPLSPFRPPSKSCLDWPFAFSLCTSVPLSGVYYFTLCIHVCVNISCLDHPFMLALCMPNLH